MARVARRLDTIELRGPPELTPGVRRMRRLHVPVPLTVAVIGARGGRRLDDHRLRR